MDIQTSEKKSIIAGCKKNESWARKRLYELYAPAMMGVCVRYTNDRETAKDILQDGFIKVFTKINSFSEEGSFDGWMFRVFATTALEFLRKNYTYMTTTETLNYDENIESFETSVIEQLSAEEIIKCISELPPGYKLVFNLHAIEGYSHLEIAKMLNIKEGSSRSQFLHARQLLQMKIAKLDKYKHARAKVK
jgi:RNA polymerase sigma-70 factor (ECF subfamily)